MRVLIIGSLAGELGQAARIAIARGAKLDQADDADAGLARLRADARVDLVLCDLAHDVGAVVRALAAERMAVPVVACGTGDDAEAAARAIREGAREFLPLPPDPDLIAAILEAAAGESHAMIVRDPAMQEAVRRAEQVAAIGSLGADRAANPAPARRCWRATSTAVRGVPAGRSSR